MAYSSLKFADSTVTRGSSKAVFFTDKGVQVDPLRCELEGVYGLVFMLDLKGRAYVKAFRPCMGGVKLTAYDSSMYFPDEIIPSVFDLKVWANGLPVIATRRVRIPDSGRHCIRLGDAGASVGAWVEEGKPDELVVGFLPTRALQALAEMASPQTAYIDASEGLVPSGAWPYGRHRTGQRD